MFLEDGEICTLLTLDQQDMEGIQANKRLTDSQNTTPPKEPTARQSLVITRKTRTVSNIQRPVRCRQDLVQF